MRRSDDIECRSVSPENRKSKTRNKLKRRKPKYLSLSLQLSEKKSQPSDHMIVSPSNGSTHDHHQLNLFPLHPENLVDDKDSTAQEENVALFFAGAENSATTLNELLVSPKDEIDSNISSSVPNYMTVSSSKASLTFADTYRGQQGELVRTALRSKEREHREEEKWVVYSDVVDFDQHSETTTRKDEEVSSCPKNKHHQQQQQLSLKLDYDEILNAWSDKGPLYLQAESSQIVPDIHDDFLAYETPFSSNGLMGSSAVLYRVPEVIASDEQREIEEEDLNWKAGRREASVLRYKVKRHNRLFSKTIRYQVRKLNAEKRPRVKGRFVKRD